MLSDHNLTTEELSDISNRIQSGQEVPFDPVSLTDSSERIAEQKYFEEQLDPDKGVLPCARCGNNFTAQETEILCLNCGLDTGEVLRVCGRCAKVYEASTNYCQECGSQLELAKRGISPMAIGRSLAVGTRRTVTTTKFWEICGALAKQHRSLSAQEKTATDREFENFAMYAATLALRQGCPSSNLASRIIEAFVATYRKAWVLSGLSTELAEGLVQLSLKRCEEYDRAALLYPDKPSLGVAEAAVRNCVGIEKDLQATMEMMAGFAGLVKLFKTVLRDTILS